jgi:FkbM family methyltransferase
MRKLSTFIRELNDTALRRYGWCAVLESSTFSSQRDEVLRKLKIDLALDVGANIGQWAIGVRRGGYKGEIISFEPDPRAIKVLKEVSKGDSNWGVFEFAVGDRDEELTLHQFHNMEEGMSSLKKPLSMTETGQVIIQENLGMETTTVPVRRLDQLVEENTLSNRNVHLKIDVQGFEKEVLDGAPNILKICKSIEIEMPLVSAYEGATQFLEISNFLMQNGFVTSTIQSERWSYPGAIDCDALFVRF